MNFSIDLPTSLPIEAIPQTRVIPHLTNQVVNCLFLPIGTLVSLKNEIKRNGRVREVEIFSKTLVLHLNNHHVHRFSQKKIEQSISKLSKRQFQEYQKQVDSLNWSLSCLSAPNSRRSSIILQNTDIQQLKPIIQICNLLSKMIEQRNTLCKTVNFTSNLTVFEKEKNLALSINFTDRNTDEFQNVIFKRMNEEESLKGQLKEKYREVTPYFDQQITPVTAFLENHLEGRDSKEKILKLFERSIDNVLRDKADFWEEVLVNFIFFNVIDKNPEPEYEIKLIKENIRNFLSTL